MHVVIAPRGRSVLPLRPTGTGRQPEPGARWLSSAFLLKRLSQGADNQISARLPTLNRVGLGALAVAGARRGFGLQRRFVSSTAAGSVVKTNQVVAVPLQQPTGRRRRAYHRSRCHRRRCRNRGRPDRRPSHRRREEVKRRWCGWRLRQPPWCPTSALSTMRAWIIAAFAAAEACHHSSARECAIEAHCLAVPRHLRHRYLRPDGLHR